MVNPNLDYLRQFVTAYNNLSLEEKRRQREMWDKILEKTEHSISAPLSGSWPRIHEDEKYDLRRGK